MTLVAQNPQQNATVKLWLTTVNYPNCPAAPGGGGTGGGQQVILDPATLAVSFWQTIPLPVPHPSVPPGVSITGKTAYLVTGGTTDPPPFVESTPLGQLTVTATGRYLVDWGDSAAPGSSGPYSFEGLPYPSGQITHVYDDVGSYQITVEELWSATWSLAGATGHLDGLHTDAVLAGYPVEQLQAVITN